MAVIRVVPVLAAADADAASRFWCDVLGMRVAMDLGWILTLAGQGSAAPQLSIATSGGSGAPVPDVSVEVTDLDAVLARVREAGIAIVHGPADEPWGVRRVLVRDPLGRLVNILTHR